MSDWTRRGSLYVPAEKPKPKPSITVGLSLPRTFHCGNCQRKYGEKDLAGSSGCRCPQCSQEMWEYT